MLTVDQIKNVSFRKANIGGYRPDEVDSFIDDVVETVEAMKKEKAELVGKMEIMMNKIEEYRKDEDSVHNALVSAQKLADQKIKEATDQAEQILKIARKEADGIVADANNRISKEKEQIVRIQQEAADIRQKLSEVYELQLEALTILPEQVDVDTVKEDLDERYPTASYSQREDEDDTQDDAFTTIEEAVEAATADYSPDGTSNSTDDSGTIQIEKSAFERKFGKLKFGEDYDVATES